MRGHPADEVLGSQQIVIGVLKCEGKGEGLSSQSALYNPV